MIFFTVGTHTLPFDRLVRAAEDYALTTDEEVVIQRGPSQITTVAGRSFDYCGSEEMDRLVHLSRAVVSQGADTVLDVLRAGKPVVAVPRMKCYREHLDDHQVDFTRELVAMGLIAGVEDLSDGLTNAIQWATSLSSRPVPPVPRPAVAVRSLLQAWFPS